jgi:hypothetical protein
MDAFYDDFDYDDAPTERPSLDGYWHCTSCDWEGDDPSFTEDRCDHAFGSFAVIDEVFCPHCGTDALEDGHRPEIEEEIEDAIC